MQIWLGTPACSGTISSCGGFLVLLENEVANINPKGKNYPNLSPGERDALINLFNDRDIIIKPANKGSAVVVVGLFS